MHAHVVPTDAACWSWYMPRMCMQVRIRFTHSTHLILCEIVSVKAMLASILSCLASAAALEKEFGITGWAARASSVNPNGAPVALLKGTATVPVWTRLHSPSAVHVKSGSRLHLALRSSLQWRPPHGWILKDAIPGLEIQRGSVLSAQSSLSWSELDGGASSGTFLHFASSSFVWWNGAQQPDGCLSLMQPVMHTVDGNSSMDIWYIPYYPKAPGDPGHGSTRTMAPGGRAYMPLLPGEQVTMGIRLLSAPQSPPLLHYLQWWSLTANSTPSAVGPAGIGASPPCGGGSYHVVHDDCDPLGEGGDCVNMVVFEVQNCRSRAARLPSGLRLGGLAECAAACAEDPRCRAINLRAANLTCELLAAHDDDDLEPSTDGWAVHVRGQALRTTIDASWTDPNGHACSTPASWTLGAVLEVFSGADVPSGLPVRLTMDDLELELAGQPPGSLPAWSTWLSDGAKDWNMSISVENDGRTITLVNPGGGLAHV
jgi:hypothetical protein